MTALLALVRVGLELALLGLIMGYLRAVPYVGPDEVFNLNVVHDVHMHGVVDVSHYTHSHSPEAFFQAARLHSFLGPIVLAVLVQGPVQLAQIPIMANLLNSIFGLEAPPSPAQIQMLTRATMGFLVWITIIFFERSLVIAARGSLRIGVAFMALMISQFHFSFFASRSIPDMIIMPDVLLTLGLFLREKAHATTYYGSAYIMITLIFSLAVSMRAELLPLALTLGGAEIYLSNQRLGGVIDGHLRNIHTGRILLCALTGVVLGVGTAVVVDSHFWPWASTDGTESAMLEVSQSKPIVWVEGEALREVVGSIVGKTLADDGSAPEDANGFLPDMSHLQMDDALDRIIEDVSGTYDNIISNTKQQVQDIHQYVIANTANVTEGQNETTATPNGTEVSVMAEVKPTYAVDAVLRALVPSNIIAHMELSPLLGSWVDVVRGVTPYPDLLYNQSEVTAAHRREVDGAEPQRLDIDGAGLARSSPLWYFYGALLLVIGPGVFALLCGAVVGSAFAAVPGSYIVYRQGRANQRPARFFGNGIVDGAADIHGDLDLDAGIDDQVDEGFVGSTDRMPHRRRNNGLNGAYHHHTHVVEDDEDDLGPVGDHNRDPNYSVVASFLPSPVRRTHHSQNGSRQAKTSTKHRFRTQSAAVSLGRSALRTGAGSGALSTHARSVATVPVVDLVDLGRITTTNVASAATSGQVTPGLLLCIGMVPVVLLSYLPVKDHRYLLPLVPVLTAAVALYLDRSLRLSQSSLRRIVVVGLTIGAVVLNSVFSTALLAVQRHDYPGGHALNALAQALDPCEPLPKAYRRSTLRVLVDERSQELGAVSTAFELDGTACSKHSTFSWQIITVDMLDRQHRLAQKAERERRRDEAEAARLAKLNRSTEHTVDFRQELLESLEVYVPFFNAAYYLATTLPSDLADLVSLNPSASTLAVAETAVLDTFDALVRDARVPLPADARTRFVPVDAYPAFEGTVPTYVCLDGILPPRILARAGIDECQSLPLPDFPNAVVIYLRRDLYDMLG
eukprot:Clim_evm11s62 gene=Clim_evmTU11s62